MKMDFERILAEVSRNGLALRNVPYQNLAICLAAVRNNRLALEYVQEGYKEAVVYHARLRDLPSLPRRVERTRGG